MSSNVPSPSPPSDRGDGEDVSRSTNGSIKDGSSLKRVREGSLEPTQAGAAIPDPIATKKNRIASANSLKSTGPNDGDLAEEPEVEAEDVDVESEEPKGSASASKEGENVGEVRKKVEKMSYEEGQSAKSPEGQADAEEDAGEEVKDAAAEAQEKDKVAVEESNSDKLKRKALERSESSFAQEDDATSKRQRDTPPPKNAEKAPLQQAKKPPTTFSSFASSASPFASLKTDSPATDTATASPTPTIAVTASAAPVKKSQATFGAFSSAQSPFASTASSSGTTTTPVSEPAPKPSSTAAPASPLKKSQATFGAFSSTSSAFAAPKLTSAFGPAPAKGLAFGNYSTTSSPFTSKQATPAQGDDKVEAGPSSFGDILKEGRGEQITQVKVEMQEQDVTTGEEDEDTVFQTRAKLYINDKEAWRERGVGQLKLNVKRSDGTGARLVMRADGVLRLMLNAKLYKGLSPQVEGKMVRIYLQNENVWEILCLRMSNPKVASDLAEHIHQHIPLDDAGSKESEV
ncbi:hypothetical protein I316_04520 [Kwoniella heveanensis BCC8398]|uniref:RanBD1 domain-containing protein n=1 Tax=Kwoniella heveanensis BCC8398 TaxID=1296120 RepID=A0A1B9GS69_9TREE|nr:hypothetical protein I316_04520 [Kwoniella heveanensis BCC8398]